MRYTIVNLYQQIWTMHQPVPQPVINMYHKQVHQPCTNPYQTTCTINKCIQPSTKYVPIMYQLLINYDWSICTNIINYTPHVCANSSTTCLNHVPTCNSTKIPHQFHHQDLICSSEIDLVYLITFLQTFLNFNIKRLAFSSNFSLVSHD